MHNYCFKKNEGYLPLKIKTILYLLVTLHHYIIKSGFMTKRNKARNFPTKIVIFVLNIYTVVTKIPLV